MQSIPPPLYLVMQYFAPSGQGHGGWNDSFYILPFFMRVTNLNSCQEYRYYKDNQLVPSYLAKAGLNNAILITKQQALC